MKFDQIVGFLDKGQMSITIINIKQALKNEKSQNTYQKTEVKATQTLKNN